MPNKETIGMVVIKFNFNAQLMQDYPRVIRRPCNETVPFNSLQIEAIYLIPRSEHCEHHSIMRSIQ
jgi:hypothetical protein